MRSDRLNVRIFENTWKACKFSIFEHLWTCFLNSLKITYGDGSIAVTGREIKARKSIENKSSAGTQPLKGCHQIKYP